MAKSIFNRLAISSILIYRQIRSPILAGARDRGFQGKICRFEPSCTEYALQAFARFPFLVALKMTISRLCRCRKGVLGGYDPIQQTTEEP